MVVWFVLHAAQLHKVCWFDQYCIGCGIIAGIVVAQLCKVHWFNHYGSGCCIVAGIFAVRVVFHLSASDRQSTKRIWNDGLFARPIFY